MEDIFNSTVNEMYNQILVQSFDATINFIHDFELV